MPKLLDLRLLRIACLRYTIRTAQLHRACAPIGCAQWQDASVPNEVSVWESRIPCQLAGWFVSAAVDSNHPALSMSLLLSSSTPFRRFRCPALAGSRPAQRRRLVKALAVCRSAVGLDGRIPTHSGAFDPLQRFPLVAAVSSRCGGFDLFPWFPWFRPVAAVSPCCGAFDPLWRFRPVAAVSTCSRGSRGFDPFRHRRAA